MDYSISSSVSMYSQLEGPLYPLNGLERLLLLLHGLEGRLNPLKWTSSLIDSVDLYGPPAKYKPYARSGYTLHTLLVSALRTQLSPEREHTTHIFPLNVSTSQLFDLSDCF